MNQIPLFGIGTYAKSVNVSAQDRLNLYVEVNEDPEKHVLTMYGMPGLVSTVNFGAFPSRGWHQLGNFMYFVNRDKFWRIANDGSLTQLGTLETNEGRVDISDNGLQIIIVDGPTGYILTVATDVFAKIVDVDFPGADTVTFLNQRFIITEPNSGKFWCTALLDGSAIDALDFATAEFAPDNLVRCMADSGQLYLFGETTTEIWGDSGAIDFPFTKVGGGAVEWGLEARWSLAKYMNSLAFLGRNRLGQVQVCVMSGANVQPISDARLDAELTSYGDMSNATGFSYMVNGHPFYQVNFPSVGKSWVYDGQSKSWSRLESFGGLHRLQGAIRLLGSIYGADYENGKVYRVDPDVYTDDGQPIAREFISRHQSVGDFSFIEELWIEAESGVGLQLGQGKDPQMMMRVSRDGGRTWGNELWRSFGKVGKYLARARWTRLGKARDWVFRFRVTDPVKVCLVAAWGKVTK